MKRAKATPEAKPKTAPQAKATTRTPAQRIKATIEAKAKAVEIHEAAPKPEAKPTPEVVAVPVAAEPAPAVTPETTPAEIVEARALVSRLQAELNTARTTLRDLTRSTARVPGVATPAQKEHGRKSWLAPCAEAPNGGPLWVKFKSPAALAAKAQAKQ